jgi:hypothetical protein
MTTAFLICSMISCYSLEYEATFLGTVRDCRGLGRGRISTWDCCTTIRILASLLNCTVWTIEVLIIILAKIVQLELKKLNHSDALTLRPPTFRPLWHLDPLETSTVTFFPCDTLTHEHLISKWSDCTSTLKMDILTQISGRNVTVWHLHTIQF